MKIKTFRYYSNQAFKNIVRNKMMSVACISTVMASLLILGVFLITMINVNYIMKNVESTVQIKVFLLSNITNEQMSMIESEMKQVEGVRDISFESKQQALEKFKIQLGEKSDLVAGVDAEKVMPKSYIISMDGPQFVNGVVLKLKSMQGIDEIKDGRQFVDKLMEITSFIRTLGIGLMLILLVVAVFLISNTIKLTVMARKREIGIMKYIGATNWFIRWPFIIEGILLGLFGALVCVGLLSYGYVLACDAVARNLVGASLVDPLDIIPYLAAIFVVLGIGIGSMGSFISMRKFLNV